jgi:serine/threonine-protein kinase
MIRIYRAVYPPPGSHYLIGIATSNLASVQLTRRRYREAERLFEEAVGIFSETQSPEHLNTGIARIKLGRALLRQRRFAEAAAHTLAGYEILVPQTDPRVSWLQTARRDLVEAYDALGVPERADRFRKELADTLETTP